jgi:hypothetical protein
MHMPRTVKNDDPLASSVLKFIPTEIVAAYLAIQNLIIGISGSIAQITTLVVSAILFVLTPLYLVSVQGVKNVAQIIVTTLSFVVWLYTLGGPFKDYGIYDPSIAAIVLILWTRIVPIIFKPKKA